MRDRQGLDAPSRSLTEQSPSRVPGRLSASQALEPASPARERAASLFTGVPWANEAELDEDSGDESGAAEAAELTPQQQEERDPTDMSADAAPDGEMVGTNGKRVSAESETDESEASDESLPHRAQLEATFGQDLGSITARRGVDLSDLGAQAAAQGERVAFADDKPSPGLVAHEVTHVLQQRRAGASSMAASSTVAPENSSAEHEAERNQRAVDGGATRVAPVSAPPSGGIHLSRTYAKEDRYNKKAVKANHKRRGKKDLDRAGVRVGNHSDVWKLDGTSADRYRIANGNVAEKVDTIRDTVEIAINPARVRQLNIPGQGPTDCCFVWARGFGAAWLPISKLAGNYDARIKSAINKRADKWRPAVHNGATEVWHFATGGMSRQANDEWIRPNTGGTPDRIQDYLEKSVNNGNGGRRSYFNVSMNLPQRDAAPVAIDFAQPNDLFFVVKGMEREISLWKKNQRGTPTGGKQRWVFGYLGKDGQPDLARRGWVPKRVLRKGRPT